MSERRSPTVVTSVPKERIGPTEETKNADLCWREGFEDGFDYAIERFEAMYRRKGFCRVTEIANILWRWSDTVLKKWKVWGEGKFLASYKDWTGKKYTEHPVHDHESWQEIRERIIRRDRGCVRCGDILNLEVDHVCEVQDGGRPDDENLRTLCRKCHAAKSLWTDGDA
jgi:hypothetical protein